MDKKKILIISQTIFPAQFPRSYRATELAKELARQGHEVILYAVLGDYNYKRFEEKHNLKIKNIGKMWFATLNSDGRGRRNFFDKVLSRILNGFIEFPDIELMFRIPNIIRKERNIDFLISVAKPFPIHWGCALSKTISSVRFPKFWAADCGDPYMGNKVVWKKPYFYFKFIEKWFCRKTDCIVVPIKGAIEGYYPEFFKKIKVIPQGFNFDDLNNDTSQNSAPQNRIPTFAYAGVFYKDFRDPTSFLEYLTKLNTPFKFIIYTNSHLLIKPYIERLKGKIEVLTYIPRNELIKILRGMDFLINFENGTTVQSPSKLIDYALTCRPILSIDTKNIPLQNINEFFKGNYRSQYIVKNIESYNIQNVARKFLDL